MCLEIIVSQDGFLRQPLHIFCSFFTLYDTVLTGPVKQVSLADKRNQNLKTFKQITFQKTPKLTDAGLKEYKTKEQKLKLFRTSFCLPSVLTELTYECCDKEHNY